MGLDTIPFGQLVKRLIRDRGKSSTDLEERSSVVHWSPYVNVYHCCTQKTASQWFKAVFSDPVIYRYTGLEVFPFTELVKGNVCVNGPVPYADFRQALPKRAIGVTLYLGYLAYLNIPKPDRYKTFFVLRDPRDIVVSWYFSVRYSHSPMGLIPKFQSDLENIDVHRGLRYCIDVLEEVGLFSVQRSWMRASNLESVRIFYYEDFARDNRAFLKDLFDYLDIMIPEDQFDALYDRHKFETYTEGRGQGGEDPTSHYRKGMAGDWLNYFDNSTIAYFKDVTGNLLTILGYQEGA